MLFYHLVRLHNKRIPLVEKLKIHPMLTQTANPAHRLHVYTMHKASDILVLDRSVC